jgi:hypothetical protein
MAAPTYNPKAPRWDGTGTLTSPLTTYNKGWGVYGPAQKYKDKNHDARNDLYHLANGSLNNNTYQWPLFVTALDIDFSVQGSTAQSRLTRDFYPHNFVQPTFQVSGQAIDEMDYGMMCDYVHLCQRNMLTGTFDESNLLQLQIAKRGIPGGRSDGLTVTTTNNGQTTTNYNQTIHGPHSEIVAIGVVTSMPRQHQAGVPAPTWAFGFQVFRMVQGPVSEGPLKSPPNEKTWVDMLKQTSANASTTSSSLLTQNTKVLNWADKHSTNVISGG